MQMDTLISKVESLLFVSGEPVSLERLVKILDADRSDIHLALQRLAERYASDQASGLMLIQDEKTALLATKPTNASALEALTKSTLQESMSKAALEVLAIIAYRAPISRSEIDAIRGVNCSFTVRNLLLRDLIAREGNPHDNRGYIYRPTLRFLQVLGLGHVSELPSYQELSQDERLRMIVEAEEAQVNPGDGGSNTHINT